MLRVCDLKFCFDILYLLDLPTYQAGPNWHVHLMYQKKTTMNGPVLMTNSILQTVRRKLIESWYV